MLSMDLGFQECGLAPLPGRGQKTEALLEGEGGRGRVREAGPGTLPDRLTQTLWEAEKLPARWP